MDARIVALLTSFHTVSRWNGQRMRLKNQVAKKRRALETDFRGVLPGRSLA